MIAIILRHTSAGEPVRLEVARTPERGDRLEHPQLGACVVSHVYDGPTPVVVAVWPREAVADMRAW